MSCRSRPGKSDCSLLLYSRNGQSEEEHSPLSNFETVRNAAHTLEQNLKALPTPQVLYLFNKPLYCSLLFQESLCCLFILYHWNKTRFLSSCGNSSPFNWGCFPYKNGRSQGAIFVGAKWGPCLVVVLGQRNRRMHMFLLEKRPWWNGKSSLRRKSAHKRKASELWSLKNNDHMKWLCWAGIALWPQSEIVSWVFALEHGQCAVAFWNVLK